MCAELLSSASVGRETAVVWIVHTLKEAQVYLGPLLGDASQDKAAGRHISRLTTWRSML